MNRRKFVAAVPVLAAGLTSFSPLLGSSLNTASEQALLEDFNAFFKAQHAAVPPAQKPMIDLISTPVSKPEFIDGKLSFKVKGGETATLFRRKGELKIVFA